MRNFLKLLLLCLLLLVSACQNSSTSPAPEENISDSPIDVSVSAAKFAELDQQKLERVLLQVVADTQKLNPQQTQLYFEKLNSQIQLECREICDIKLLRSFILQE